MVRITLVPLTVTISIIDVVAERLLETAPKVGHFTPKLSGPTCQYRVRHFPIGV